MQKYTNCIITRMSHACVMICLAQQGTILESCSKSLVISAVYPRINSRADKHINSSSSRFLGTTNYSSWSLLATSCRRHVWTSCPFQREPAFSFLNLVLGVQEAKGVSDVNDVIRTVRVESYTVVRILFLPSTVNLPLNFITSYWKKEAQFWKTRFWY